MFLQKRFAVVAFAAALAIALHLVTWFSMRGACDAQRTFEKEPCPYVVSDSADPADHIKVNAEVLAPVPAPVEVEIDVAPRKPCAYR